MRLNRFLARAGISSRRKCDALIQAGVVKVNGEVVVDPWKSIEVGRDCVEAQGCRVALPDAYQYIAFYKPTGCLVTRRDTHGRPTIYDYLAGLHPGTVAVGRLDQDTTGLVLLTDDGELAFRLAHPRFAIAKQYEAVVRGRPGEAALDQLRGGIELDDGRTAPAQVELAESRTVAGGVETRVMICLREGRKRQVRRMFRMVGHPVRTLERVAFAGLTLDLPQPGSYRSLTAAEISSLRVQVGLEQV